MRPHSPSTMTTSSMRMGCVKAICSPAMKVPMVFWAARPTTMPTMPADARMAVPSCLILGNVIRMEARAMITMTMMMIRRRTLNWVCIFRARNHQPSDRALEMLDEQFVHGRSAAPSEPTGDLDKNVVADERDTNGNDRDPQEQRPGLPAGVLQ